jgi:hypothetical protein
MGGMHNEWSDQHCFICCPSVSTVSEGVEIEPRTTATLALLFRRSFHSAISHPRLGYISSMELINPVRTVIVAGCSRP